MDRTLFRGFFLFLLVLTANGKFENLKICAVGRSARTTKYCDLLAKSKRSPVSCVYRADRLECLRAVSTREADLGVFEAEDLYFSSLEKESSVLVVSEIRGLRSQPFSYGTVVLVRKDSNITGIEDLRGKTLCHPGLESGPDWSYLFAQYFEERVAPAECEEGISVYEDRFKTTSNFFGSACKAGPWNPVPEEDARLKKKYWNLCALCDNGDCSNAEKYRGSGGSITCFKDKVGEVLWARHEDVKAHLKFLEGGADDSTSEHYYLCDDGTLMSIESEEPCLWLARPWQVVVANRKSATEVQKIVDVLGDDEHNEWEENLLHVMELYLQYLTNIMTSKTPEDYLRKIPGYLSASSMSEANCKPSHAVRLCTTSPLQLQKCDWMSKAGSALAIQPSLECVQKPNVSACLDFVAEEKADVVVVPPDFLYDATVKSKLKTFLYETGNSLNDTYLVSLVVKKNSDMRTLEDLRGKKICFTRKNGIGWKSLVASLRRESLVDSECRDREGLSRYFGQLCVLPENRNEGEIPCCPLSDFFGSDDEKVLHCLQESGCDVAVVDSNALKEDSGGGKSKDLRVLDFRRICRGNEGPECSWMWSYPNYLMTHFPTNSPKSLEALNVFFQLGQYFGRNSRKNNPMLKIFGPFHQNSNVLFRDTSTSFIPLVSWNRSDNYLEAVEKMKICSSSPPTRLPSLALVVFLVCLAAKNSRLIC